MINEKDLTKYYQSIANKLNEIMPVDWDEIVMYGEELGDVSTACFYYKPKGQNNYRFSGRIPDDYSVDCNIYFDLIDELMEINKALWEEFVKAEVPDWKTITFRLYRDYHFNINYKYDIDTEIGDLERVIRWAYDELGIIPEDDFGKKLLNEYLHKDDN